MDVIFDDGSPCQVVTKAVESKPGGVDDADGVVLEGCEWDVARYSAEFLVEPALAHDLLPHEAADFHPMEKLSDIRCT